MQRKVNSIATKLLHKVCSIQARPKCRVLIKQKLHFAVTQCHCAKFAVTPTSKQSQHKSWLRNSSILKMFQDETFPSSNQGGSQEHFFNH